MDKIFNQELFDAFSVDAFEKRWPYPWYDFEKLLTPEAFNQLQADFPPLELFEYHENLYRQGQRPHNRYYLAYGQSIYDSSKENMGIIQHDQLPASWQQFINELESGPIYRNFINKILLEKKYTIRYCWHAGKSSNEVSPHKDNPDKIATHIFYFNTSEDWDAAWGGQILVLGDPLVSGIKPDFSDFATAIPVKNMDNHSFLFKNTQKAWHGVKPLKCPAGKYRKLFNVIFQEIQ